MVTTGKSTVAVIGAGPYGLAITSHLRSAGVDVRTFGRPMEFWERNMPKGMLLRSAWEASHIADPDGSLTLDAYEAESARRLGRPIPLEDFVEYGRWYQRQGAPNLDTRTVVRLERSRGGFELTLSDEGVVDAARVVIAVGPKEFAWRPPAFRNLPPEVASHTVDHADLGRFAGQHVAVVGCGQSGVESAALLAESGATVELFARAPTIRWLARPRGRDLPARLGNLLYPPTDVGPPPLNWIVALPQVFRAMPSRLRPHIAYRCVRPAAASWLRDRIEGVRVAPHTVVVGAAAQPAAVALMLENGGVRRFDHVLLATGYRVDIGSLPFLSAGVGSSIATTNGSPVLSRGLESSVPGLYFVGAAAAASVGPIMRFVVGTTYAARAVAEHVLQASELGMRETVRAYARRRGRLSAAVP